MITIYTIAFNEELMLPFFIAHYRKMFPGCKIVVYDNESTDKTVEIAHFHGCEVVTYCTNNQLSDRKYLDIKNKCWKDAQTNWVLIADVDEFCHISQEQLQKEQDECTTVINFLGFNMVNHANNFDVNSINKGVRAPSYDKIYLFDKDFIDNITYGWGAHSAQLEGDAIFSEKKYICRHYKYINPDYMVTRHGMFAKRLSKENLEKGYGGHYLYSPEEIKKEFYNARIQSSVVNL
jgi:glycosyltransferase involved in cell wall biosynthesis